MGLTASERNNYDPENMNVTHTEFFNKSFHRENLRIHSNGSDNYYYPHPGQNISMLAEGQM